MGDLKLDDEGLEFSVGGLLRTLLTRWPILLGVGLAGAVAGFAISLFRPPVYEARATMGVTINYALSQPLELVVEDRVYDRVSSIMLEDATMQLLINDLPAEMREPRGWALPADLRDSLRVDRKLSEWDLTVDDPDPQVAAEVANLWADTSLDILGDALDHGGGCIQHGGLHAWAGERGLVGGTHLGVSDCAYPYRREPA
jgi:uncharacterized protein involved in exopolysaccharide biosynthesis